MFNNILVLTPEWPSATGVTSDVWSGTWQHLLRLEEELTIQLMI
jgi:hypothetical protein